MLDRFFYCCYDGKVLKKREPLTSRKKPPKYRVIFENSGETYRSRETGQRKYIPMHIDKDVREDVFFIPRQQRFA